MRSLQVRNLSIQHRHAHHRLFQAARLGKDSNSIEAHPNTRQLRTYENLRQEDWKSTSGRHYARTDYWQSMLASRKPPVWFGS
jgi:hypothetical protein